MDIENDDDDFASLARDISERRPTAMPIVILIVLQSYVTSIYQNIYTNTGQLRDLPRGK
jgi:hypothetical protein